MEPIMQFIGEYRFLSNFWLEDVLYCGNVYPSAEHAYQASKPAFKDEHDAIKAAKTPGIAKRLGNKCSIRSDWEHIKLSVMRRIVRNKFIYNEQLALKLLATGDAQLIEGNTWGDTFWGVSNGIGQNNLGFILMDVREELR